MFSGRGVAVRNVPVFLFFVWNANLNVKKM